MAHLIGNVCYPVPYNISLDFSNKYIYMCVYIIYILYVLCVCRFGKTWFEIKWNEIVYFPLLMVKSVLQIVLLSCVVSKQLHWHPNKCLIFQNCFEAMQLKFCEHWVMSQVEYSFFLKFYSWKLNNNFLLHNTEITQSGQPSKRLNDFKTNVLSSEYVAKVELCRQSSKRYFFF